MKAIALIPVLGSALLLASGYAILAGGVLTTRREVLDMGGVQLSAEQSEPIAPWVAGIGLVLGTAMLVHGITRKR